MEGVTEWKDERMIKVWSRGPSQATGSPWCKSSDPIGWAAGLITAGSQVWLLLSLSHFVLVQHLQKLPLAWFVLQVDQKLFHARDWRSDFHQLATTPESLFNQDFFYFFIVSWVLSEQTSDTQTLKLSSFFFSFVSHELSTYFDISFRGDVKLSEKRRRSGN